MLAHFQTAAMRAPRPRFHHYHSWMMAAQRAGETDAMAEAERALVHHWPDAQATWEAIAQFYYPTDPEKGLAAMRRILALGPSATAHLGLAYHSQRSGDTAEALRHYDEALKTDAGMPVAHLLRATLLLREKRFGPAARGFVRTVELAPTYLVAPAIPQLLQALAQLPPREIEAILGGLSKRRAQVRDAAPQHLDGEALAAVRRAIGS